MLEEKVLNTINKYNMIQSGDGIVNDTFKYFK